MKANKTSLKFFLLSLLLSPGLLSAQPVNCRISGKLVDDGSQKALYVLADSPQTVTLQPDGSFEFTVHLAHPLAAIFYSRQSSSRPVWISGDSLWLELDVKQQASGAALLLQSLKGSRESQTFFDFNRLLDSISLVHPRRDVLGTDTIGLAAYPFVKNEVQQNPEAYLSAYLAGRYHYPLEGRKELLTLLANNPDTITKEDMRNAIARDDSLPRGTRLADFSLPTPRGKSIELYQVKAKLILIQFWAAWCAPCRTENQELASLYKQYHDHGFEIIGISLDNKLTDWKKALKQDRMSWINVSDLKGWDSFLARRYSIDFVPYLIILDDSYRILASGIRPAQVRQIIERYRL